MEGSPVSRPATGHRSTCHEPADEYILDAAFVAISPRDGYIAALRQTGAVFQGPLPDTSPACRDPDDDHILAAAVAVRAEFTVTGDKDLPTLGRFQSVRIVTPRAFLAELSSARP